MPKKHIVKNKENRTNICLTISCINSPLPSGKAMHADNYFKILNILSVWVGVVFILSGVSQMKDAGYYPPEVPAGWVMGMFWISVGGGITLIWVMYIVAQLIDQKIQHTKRWRCSQMASASLMLIIAMGCASVGTYLTWKHPYRIGDCGCTEDEWGLNCTPCDCVNGVCHSGIYGTGICACDFAWAGDKCDRCDERHKPEPVGAEPACDKCKTGYTGEKCDRCAVGYAGEYCDMCALGWQPWQHSSDIFPNTIADDNRHLCDECIPNHWGFYCLSCPVGNDVPKITLQRNDRLQIGVSRATDNMGYAGYLEDLEICTDDNCQHWAKGEYDDVNNPLVVKETRIKIKYDSDKTVSDWFILDEIRGFQCNNRGTCMDDAQHQELQTENGFNWQATCTKSTDQMCNTHDDCKVSQNCKGTCDGIELPKNPFWENWNVQGQDGLGQLCASDDECLGPAASTDTGGNPVYYTGGKCVAKFCCDETYHGTGVCDCKPEYFGPKSEEGFQSHYELSPACDFCPGYDWLTEEPTSICSGGKGTCIPEYKSAPELGARGAYLLMSCKCGDEVFVDPETKIVDVDTVITWSGDVCQCGHVDEDGVCDFCASGHWGDQCKTCPGGPGSRACSGHGTCSSGRDGDGSCTCSIDVSRPSSSSWMLGEYVPRFDGDCFDCQNEEDINGGKVGPSKTCNECAPNFYGEQCRMCPDTFQKLSTELDDIFQPQSSYTLGKGQSPLGPTKMCHPQMPWVCTIACGQGGWCDWGRKGEGTCMCWSNKRAEPKTWNPLDNVCIGNERFDPESEEEFDGTKEQCPAYGYCDGQSSRHYCPTNQTSGSKANCDKPHFKACGPPEFIGTNKTNTTLSDSTWTPADDWTGSRGTPITCQCQPFNKIDWAPDNSQTSCTADP